MTKRNKFWSEYKSMAIRSLLGLPFGFFISILFGFFFGNTVAGVIVVAGFVITMYYGIGYRIAVCPHCNQYPKNYKNFFYPTNQICNSCKKDMSCEDVD